VPVLLTQAQKDGSRKLSEILTTVVMKLKSTWLRSGYDDGVRNAMLPNLHEHIIADDVDGSSSHLPL